MIEQCHECRDHTSPCDLCNRCRRHLCTTCDPDGIICEHPDCPMYVCGRCAAELESRLRVCRDHLEFGVESIWKELREARRRIEAAAAVLVIADEQTDFAHFGPNTPEGWAELSGRLAGAIRNALTLLRK